jgi:hypothetical protein
MNSPGWRSSADKTVLADALMPGTTAPAWAFTRAVSWSRSLRRNGRTSADDIGSLLGRTRINNGGRYQCGTRTHASKGRPDDGRGSETR